MTIAPTDVLGWAYDIRERGIREHRGRRSAVRTVAVWLEQPQCAPPEPFLSRSEIRRREGWNRARLSSLGEPDRLVINPRNARRSVRMWRLRRDNMMALLPPHPRDHNPGGSQGVEAHHHRATTSSQPPRARVP